MLGESVTFPFPLAPHGGRFSASTGDEALRGQIIQVLFTAPGERVNQPEFGCGLLNLVFEPNDAVLAAAAEFTIGQALARWLGDSLMVDDVRVSPEGATVNVEIAYTRRLDATRQLLRVQFR
jgi:hypothetical protein